MLTSENCSLLSVGIDWLTATSASSEAYMDALQCLKAMDGEPENFEFMGYLGQIVNNVFVGVHSSLGQSRPYILRVSGSECSEFVRLLEYSLLPEWRASRLDIQMTYELGEPMAIGDILYARDDVNSTGYYKDAKGGVTCYVNRRSGDAFARVYDKGIESGATDEVGLVWRFEVELKRVMAAMYFAQIYQTGMGRADVKEKVSAMVWGWFDDRGINLPKNVQGKMDPISIPRPESDTDKKLNWLRTQVRKALHKLCDEVGEEVVAEALSLQKIRRYDFDDGEDDAIMIWSDPT